MRLSIRSVFWLAVVVLAVSAAPASAQYRRFATNTRATGETYHVEFGVGLWSPEPNMVVSSEALGLIGSQIDAVNDLGMQKGTFKEFRLVLRPAKKHKFLLDYIPVSYSAESTLKRSIVFNGVVYNVGLPVNSSLTWKMLHFGYEYDFIYRDRGFVGLILQGKYTDVEVNLRNPLNSDYAHVRAPIPAIGGIVRVYPFANVGLTGQVTGFKLPTSVDAQNRYDGKYIDFDLYATLNFTDKVGVQGGYRSQTVDYRVRADTGNFELKGPYIMGIARF
jgi:hypothetical protein